MRNKNFVLSLKEKENVNVSSLYSTQLRRLHSLWNPKIIHPHLSFFLSAISSPTNPRPPLDPPPPVRRVTGQPSIGFFLSSITRCTRDKTPFLHSVPPFSRLCHYAASRLPRRIPRKRKLIVAEEEETARLVTVLLQPDRKGRRGPR